MKIKLKELQDKKLAYATIDDLPFDLKIKKGAEKSQKSKKAKEDFIEVINEYLKIFVADKKCINCEEDLSGLFGTFNWGIVHGEGSCSNCGYPARGRHYIKLKKLVVDDKEKNELILPFVLQYHPNELKQRRK